MRGESLSERETDNKSMGGGGGGGRAGALGRKGCLILNPQSTVSIISGLNTRHQITNKSIFTVHITRHGMVRAEDWEQVITYKHRIHSSK